MVGKGSIDMVKEKIGAVGDIWKFTTSWSDGESHSHYLLFLKENKKENLFYDIEHGQSFTLAATNCFKDIAVEDVEGISYWDWEYVA